MDETTREQADKIGDVARAAEDADPLVVVPIPALVAVLLHREREKGSPLTEAEVLAVRDEAVCITMRYSAAAAIAEGRGYDDIAPENVWEEWNAVQPSLQGP